MELYLNELELQAAVESSIRLYGPVRTLLAVGLGGDRGANWWLERATQAQWYNEGARFGHALGLPEPVVQEIIAANARHGEGGDRMLREIIEAARGLRTIQDSTAAAVLMGMLAMLGHPPTVAEPEPERSEPAATAAEPAATATATAAAPADAPKADEGPAVDDPEETRKRLVAAGIIKADSADAKPRKAKDKDDAGPQG